MLSTVPPTTIVPTPALLSTTSRRPNARTARPTTAAQSSGFPRSAAIAATSPPAARTSASVRASSGSRTSTRATRAPARAKSSALARAGLGGLDEGRVLLAPLGVGRGQDAVHLQLVPTPPAHLVGLITIHEAEYTGAREQGAVSPDPPKRHGAGAQR